MSVIERAARLAVAAHVGQVRKSDGSPYIVHPYMVAMLVMRHGYGDEVVAAALVHDVLEDTDVSEDELCEQLGSRVVAIVRAVSEDKTLPWKVRKEQYIKSVQQASNEVKVVSIADKIHNVQSMIDAHEKSGTTLWDYFRSGKKETLWFYQAMLQMFRESWNHPLVDEYAVLVGLLEALD